MLAVLGLGNGLQVCTGGHVWSRWSRARSALVLERCPCEALNVRGWGKASALLQLYLWYGVSILPCSSLCVQEARRSSRFALLALLAAEEALADAGWGVAARQCGLDNRSSSGSSTGSSSGGGGRGGALTLTPAQLEATGVAVGNGMSCTTEVSEAGALVTAGRGRRVSPFFVPRILPNMAAGAISIR